MKKKSQVAHGNISRTGWWLYREVEKWVPNKLKKETPSTRYKVWENTRIIQAKDRDEAYEKAMSMGCSSKTNNGEWRFVGISQLLPIYEELEDGAEIMWDELGSQTVKSIKKLVKSKKRLAVFDDTQPTPLEF